MAKPQPPAQKANQNSNKSGGIGSAFKAFTSTIDEIVNEVKRDLRDMTPQEKSAVEKRNQDLNVRSQNMGRIIGSATTGVAENEVYGSPQESQSIQHHEAPSHQLPAGNLWHALSEPQLTQRLRADACYHALTVADIEGYARALKNESKPPYTLGILAANFTAITEEETTEPAAPDLLTATLLNVINAEPRLFGAVGAGPRQLWPDIKALDVFLTNLLNTNQKIIAIGPIGLDEPFAPYTLPAQQAQFALQIEIAHDFGIPAIVSTRKTHAKMHETLASIANRPKLIYLDALTTPEDAELVQQFGMHALIRPELTQPDFPGFAHYRNLPPEKRLLASGSALVAPHGFSGHFNQPKFLTNSLESAAKRLQESSPAQLHGSVNGNIRAIFNI